MLRKLAAVHLSDWPFGQEISLRCWMKIEGRVCNGLMTPRRLGWKSSVMLYKASYRNFEIELGSVFFLKKRLRAEQKLMVSRMIALLPEPRHVDTTFQG